MKIKHLIPVLLIAIGCKNTPPLISDPIPAHETFNLNSKILNESRVINVWLPENYKDSSKKLPVLYMADGGTREDFPHIANTLDKLIKTKEIPATILVGIENIQRRKDLTPETTVEEDKKVAPFIGGAENFRNFIKEELIPEIKKKYRTTAEKGIIGESLSGLFVTETFVLYPEMFDYYIAFDPSLWWNNQYLNSVAQERLSKISSKKRFWFAGSEVAKDANSSIKNLKKILENQNSEKIIWIYSDEPKEKHSTIFRATKEKALIWTLNK